jgi:gamma-glutamyl:cysteine ligase YbdK (ATP-grasp superfamily)
MSRLHLFQGYGVESEYMIVDRDSLSTKPLADELLKHELGHYGSDFASKDSFGENGIVTWSNELVLHVIELKSTKPEFDFDSLERAFVENINRINAILSQWNAMLMPTAAHPWMNPLHDAKLWPHDNNEVYEVYNRIFGCKGHGWSNLQSTHLNLPFYDEDEFAKLHAATRLVLPILPALCASSPIIDGKFTGLLDTRLKYYKENQKRIPSITGDVIPEAVFSGETYQKNIYEKIKADIRGYDPEEILDPVWVNSRGAISRFDRGSIEIRLMDVQECPAADLAILSLVIETIKSLVVERFISYEEQKKWQPEPLAVILDGGVANAEQAVITNHQYLAVFGMEAKSLTAGELWQHIHQQLQNNGDLLKREEALRVILNRGSLSTRIINALNGDFSMLTLTKVYQKLSACLAENRMFF